MDTSKSNSLFPPYNGAQNSRKIIMNLPYFPTCHHTYSTNIINATLIILSTPSLNLILSHPHLSIFSLSFISQNQNSKISQLPASAPKSNRTLGVTVLIWIFLKLLLMLFLSLYGSWLCNPYKET